MKKKKKNSGYFSPVNELRGKILLEIMINTIRQIEPDLVSSYDIDRRGNPY